MEKEKIKLIWDFRGDDAEGIAKHHAIHLNEFALREKLEVFSHGDEKISGSHFIAFITVSKENMIQVRDALRPHRGEIAQ